ncbi:hypothetical protein [Azospirillum brasilense]|uniref:hypothetical protein n=1 Tax=Azospirillum brasilense TaxID=192 RepID=UPI0010C0D95D|nr:hypothetical protein [Azospirillum brasilense]
MAHFYDAPCAVGRERALSRHPRPLPPGSSSHLFPDLPQLRHRPVGHGAFVGTFPEGIDHVRREPDRVHLSLGQRQRSHVRALSQQRCRSVELFQPLGMDPRKITVTCVRYVVTQWFMSHMHNAKPLHATAIIRNVNSIPWRRELDETESPPQFTVSITVNYQRH